MQQRIKQTALGLALIVSTTMTYAADPSFFNNTAPSSRPSSSSSGFPTPSVMSSGDFSSRVKNLNQETKSRLSQEASGLIPKLSAETPAPTTAQPTAPVAAATTTTGGQSGSTFTGFGTGTAPSSGSTSGSDSNTKFKPSAPAKSSGFQIQY